MESQAKSDHLSPELQAQIHRKRSMGARIEQHVIKAVPDSPLRLSVDNRDGNSPLNHKTFPAR